MSMMLPVGPASARARMDVLTHIQLAGLTADLQLCLDAGDEASYTSGQVWTDLSSSGSHFNRGTTNGSESSDPTFNGTAGRRSSGEFFSFDGGDRFQHASSIASWMQNMSKNNARFSFFSVHRMPSGAANNARLFSTLGSGFSDLGLNAFINTDGVFGINAVNAGEDGFWVPTSLGGDTDTDMILAAAHEVEAGGAQERARIRTGSVVSIGAVSDANAEIPASGNATGPMNIGYWNSASNPNGFRHYCFAVWSAFKNATQTGALAMSYRGKLSY